MLRMVTNPGLYKALRLPIVPRVSRGRRLRPVETETNMTTPVAVTNFQVKSHDSPDEVRAPDKTRVEVNKLEGYTIGRFIFQPGWRWSECIKPVVKTDQCQLSHVGYAVAGRIRVHMNDGT